MSDEERRVVAKQLFVEGQTAFEQGEPLTALTKWEEAYNTYAPQMHMFGYHIGKAALELGDCDRAKIAFERFLDLVPKHASRADAMELLLNIERSGCAAPTGLESGMFALGRDARLPLVSEQLEVQINHQHAHGVLHQQFDNKVGDTVEGWCQFFGGPGANVVGFAYWNDEEKIVGEVFEKRVASLIYNRTVGRRLDPGLLTKNRFGQFSFTVFPIARDERKKVEVQFEQWLVRRGNQMELRVPLRSIDTDIDIRIHEERNAAAFHSPTHQIALRGEGDHDVRVQSGRARPEADALVLQWTIREDPGQLRGFIHRAPGQDAFLVLTMAPLPGSANRRARGKTSTVAPGPALTQLEVDARGPGLYGIHPRSLPDLPPDEALLVVARVEGQGALDLRVTGQGARGPFVAEHRITIPEQASAPWVARVWARHRIEFLVRQIEQLGERPPLVNEVVELSLVYNILTPFTAFLAMPMSELRIDTADLMHDARAHKRRVLTEHPDASAIRGLGGDGPSASVGDDEDATQMSAPDRSTSAPPEAQRRDTGSAAGCASCRAGGDSGPLGLLLGLWLVRRRRRTRD